MSRLVVALLGTDHHPFDRLVRWTDLLAAEHRDADVVVQYGHSEAPVLAAGRPFFTHDELTELLRRADAVVCHGGPGTIMDARAAGHVPVCVPRDPAAQEHVDGHQQRFAEVAESAGFVHLARSCDDVLDAVGRLLTDAPARVPGALGRAGQDAAARFAQQIDPVVGRRVRRRGSIRRALLSRVSR